MPIVIINARLQSFGRTVSLDVFRVGNDIGKSIAKAISVGISKTFNKVGPIRVADKECCDRPLVLGHNDHRERIVAYCTIVYASCAAWQRTHREIEP